MGGAYNVLQSLKLLLSEDFSVDLPVVRHVSPLIFSTTFLDDLSYATRSGTLV